MVTLQKYTTNPQITPLFKYTLISPYFILLFINIVLILLSFISWFIFWSDLSVWGVFQKTTPVKLMLYCKIESISGILENFPNNSSQLGILSVFCTSKFTTKIFGAACGDNSQKHLTRTKIHGSQKKPYQYYYYA